MVALALATGTTTLTINHVREKRIQAQVASWDSPRLAGEVLDSTPPQVTIIPHLPPSAFKEAPAAHDPGNIRLPDRHPGDPKTVGSVSPSGNVRMAGYGLSLSQIMELAINQNSILPEPRQNVRQISWEGGLPGRHGKANSSQNRLGLAKCRRINTIFIANLPDGNQAALLKVIQDKFDVVAEHATIQTNGYALQVDHADAPDLKPAADTGIRKRTARGKQDYRQGNHAGICPTAI